MTELSNLPTLSTHLGAHGLAMLLFTALIFAIFIWDRISIDYVCLGMLVAIPLGFVLFPMQVADGYVDPSRFFAGFGHPALITICGLMIVGHGLVVTGALEPVARKLAGWVAASPKTALLAVLAGAAGVSGVVNDTPVVVLMIPLIIAAAKRAGVSPGTMLLPMNYAVLIGGMATTIGTSTNLIVVAIAVGLGVGPFEIFGHYHLVAAAAVPALAYLWLVAPRLLGHIKPGQEMLAEQVFTAELNIEEGSWLDGRQLREAMAARGNRLSLLSLRRNGKAVARLPSLILKAKDVLVIQDTAANLKDIESGFGAALHTLDEDPDPSANIASNEPRQIQSSIIAQLIITPASSMVGRSVKTERLAERYGVIVVGLRAQKSDEQWQRENLIERTIGAGDILLLQGNTGAIQAVQRDGVGLLLDASLSLPRQKKAGIALFTMAAVVILASTKIMPIALAALAGVIVLLATKCMSLQDATQSLSVKVVLLVASSLALGDALAVTGATDWLAQQMAFFARGLSPAWVLALLMGLMGILTNFVSNNASAAIGTPLAIGLARALGVPPEPFVLAVLFGCNLCYLTPMGYQTNLLVMNSGGYRFGDFVRVGTPLFLIMWAGLAYGLVVHYGI